MPPSHRPVSGIAFALLITLLAGCRALASDPTVADIRALTPAGLYQESRIWTVELRVADDQWTAMEPKGGGFSFFGGPPPGAGTGSSPSPRPRGPGIFLQGAEGKRNGLASAMGIEFEYAHADLTVEGVAFTNVGVRYKGNGTFLQSRSGLKRSLKLDLIQYSKGQKLAGITKLNLHNCITDASWMNEVLSYRLFRDAGVPAPRTAYARVFVTVPGKHDHRYFGLYSLVENVDNAMLEDRLGFKPTALFKPVTPELFSDLGDDWAHYKQTYDPKGEPTAADTGRVIAFAKLVTHADDATFSKRLPEFLDLEGFARFMAVTTWLSTMDSILGPGQNYYVFLHPKTGRFQFVPWDLDHSFGQFPLIGSQNAREKLSILQPWQGENRFLERVFAVDSFKSLYLARMREFQGTLFKPERLSEQVDTLATVLRPPVKEESENLLARFDQVVAGEAVPPVGFGGPPRAGAGNRPGQPSGGTPGGFGMGFFQPPKPIKGFVPIRAKSVADQLEGRSKGETVSRFGFPGQPPPGAGGPR